MSDTKQRTIEGWIDQASSQLQTAKDCSKSSYRCAEAIQASQLCIELSVKAILTMLCISYPKAHQWAAEKQPFADIAKEIKKREIIARLEAQYLNISLPRLLLLMSFWGQLYLVSKYGFEAEFLASAQELFKPEEAKLAIQHADECYQAATTLRYLDKNKLESVIAK